MKNKKVLAVVAAVAVLFGGFTVVKVRAAGEEKGRSLRGTIIHRIISELELKEDQIEKIKTELRAEKDTLVPLLKQLHQTRKDLRETVQAGGSEIDIRKAAAKVGAVQANLAVERAKLHKKIAPILTEEQITKAKALEEKVDDFVLKALKQVGDRLEAKQ